MNNMVIVYTTRVGEVFKETVPFHEVKLEDTIELAIKTEKRLWSDALANDNFVTLNDEQTGCTVIIRPEDIYTVRVFTEDQYNKMKMYAEAANDPEQLKQVVENAKALAKTSETKEEGYFG